MEISISAGSASHMDTSNIGAGTINQKADRDEWGVLNSAAMLITRPFAFIRIAICVVQCKQPSSFYNVKAPKC